ncbi:hypothetical protein [Mesorhizobium sp.]|uniref:hypothetical protein n=1 Tax=Mesorhizobium sp. TaxID=1871066 RepID=UPI000FE4CCBE|nr:hypothetical protein [Mesorhizobium sp.]RWA70565.1 MAG: hypothetical protein EOQ29_13375 [Mesorhizobium sp.]RWA83484.1 MAG: hypothetical protein EOQ30_13310 [Mesorhizobium sp.]
MLLLTLAFSVTVSAAFAESKSSRMGLAMTSPASGQLKAKQLYVVEITCRPLKKDLSGAIKQSAFGLVKTTETSSHLLMLSAKRPTQTGGKTVLPDSALFSNIVFSINTADVLDQRKCNDYFFVSGGKSYFLTVVENYSKEHAPGQAISILKNGIKLAQPLFTLFGAGELSLAVQPLLTAATGVETPYRDLLAELNKGDNLTKSEPLVPGTYQVSTQYSAETVTVREIASAVTDRNTGFTALFDQQLTDTKRMQPPVTHETCNTILGDLNALGFNSPTDQGYALVQLAFRAGIKREDVLKACLPLEPAMAMARLGDFYWKGLPGYRFSEPEVQNANLIDESKRIIPPPFEAAVPSIVKLIDAGNQILRLDDAPATAIAKTNEIFADKISVIDNTNDALFGSLEGKPPLDALLQLKNKGVTRLGCYVQTSGATDAASDGAVAILLGFVIPVAAKEAGAEDAITLRPSFANGKISSLSISKNRAWIDSVLTNRTSCNELKIKK